MRFCLSYRFLGPDLVRLAVAAGDRERAAAIAQEIADGAQRSGVAGAAEAALHCRGLVDDDPAARLAAVQTYRQVRAGRVPRPSVGWESLTDSELGVARLAAEGLTNRQIGDRLFISRRTVGTHLAHLFQKLGINSRTQRRPPYPPRTAISIHVALRTHHGER